MQPEKKEQNLAILLKNFGYENVQYRGVVGLDSRDKKYMREELKESRLYS